MKKFKVRFFRSNEQLTNGGYEFTKEVTVEDMQDLADFMDRWCGPTAYGSIDIVDWEEVR